MISRFPAVAVAALAPQRRAWARRRAGARHGELVAADARSSCSPSGWRSSTTRAAGASRPTAAHSRRSAERVRSTDARPGVAGRLSPHAERRVDADAAELGEADRLRHAHAVEVVALGAPPRALLVASAHRVHRRTPRARLRRHGGARRHDLATGFSAGLKRAAPRTSARRCARGAARAALAERDVLGVLAPCVTEQVLDAVGRARAACSSPLDAVWRSRVESRAVRLEDSSAADEQRSAAPRAATSAARSARGGASSTGGGAGTCGERAPHICAQRMRRRRGSSNVHAARPSCTEVQAASGLLLLAVASRHRTAWNDAAAVDAVRLEQRRQHRVGRAGPTTVRRM